MSAASVASSLLALTFDRDGSKHLDLAFAILGLSFHTSLHTSLSCFVFNMKATRDVICLCLDPNSRDVILVR
jgi:hypothetical protein